MNISVNSATSCWIGCFEVSSRSLVAQNKPSLAMIKAMYHGHSQLSGS